MCDATAVSGYKGAKQDGLQNCNIGIVYCSQLFLQVGYFSSCQHEVYELTATRASKVGSCLVDRVIIVEQTTCT